MKNIFLYHIFFYSSHLIRVEKTKKKFSHIIFVNCRLFKKCLCTVHKVTVKNATLQEVNTSIASQIANCVFLGIATWIIFLKFLEFNSFWEHP